GAIALLELIDELLDPKAGFGQPLLFIVLGADDLFIESTFKGFAEIGLHGRDFPGPAFGVRRPTAFLPFVFVRREAGPDLVCAAAGSRLFLLVGFIEGMAGILHGIVQPL